MTEFLVKNFKATGASGLSNSKTSDKVATDWINQMAQEGWELFQITDHAVLGSSYDGIIFAQSVTMVKYD